MKVDMSLLSAGLSRFGSKSDIAFRMYAETSAQRMLNEAKNPSGVSYKPDSAHGKGQSKRYYELMSTFGTRLKWKDQSHRARASLSADVERKSYGFRIKLAHGVDYGIWLEVAFEKVYAVIKPTIEKYSEKIMSGFIGMIDRMR